MEVKCLSHHTPTRTPCFPHDSTLLVLTSVTWLSHVSSTDVPRFHPVFLQNEITDTIPLMSGGCTQG